MKNLLAIVLFLSSFFMYSQSPWTQKKGKFYTQFSFSSVPSYDVIYGSPDYKISGKLSDNTLQFYTEYGFSDKTTIIVNVPYKMINRTNFSVPFIDCFGSPCAFNNNKTNLGNIEIGIKHNFSSKKWLVTGQFLIATNTSSFDAFSGIRTGYNAWSFTPLFIVGKSTKKTYLQLFTGLTYRTNNYSTNFKIGGEYGWKFGEHFWFASFIDVVKSFKNGTISLPFSNKSTALYVNNQEFGGFGFKGIYEFSSSFGVTAGLGGAFFANNVAKQAALNIGLFKKF